MSVILHSPLILSSLCLTGRRLSWLADGRMDLDPITKKSGLSVSFFQNSFYGLLHVLHTAKRIRIMHSQKSNCAVLLPTSIFIHLWAIYIFHGSVHLFCCRPNRQTDQSWEYLNRSQSHRYTKVELGLKSRSFLSGNDFPHFRCSIFSVQCSADGTRTWLLTVTCWIERPCSRRAPGRTSSAPSRTWTGTRRTSSCTPEQEVIKLIDMSVCPDF